MESYRTSPAKLVSSRGAWPSAAFRRQQHLCRMCCVYPSHCVEMVSLAAVISQYSTTRKKTSGQRIKATLDRQRHSQYLVASCILILTVYQCSPAPATYGAAAEL